MARYNRVNLDGKSVFLMGAGKMCELAARHLLAHGAKPRVENRPTGRSRKANAAVTGYSAGRPGQIRHKP